MTTDHQLRERVREIGPGKVAERSGISFSTLSTWLTNPDADMRAKNKTALITAVRSFDIEKPDTLKHAGQTFYPVPVFDVRAHAGAGALVEDGEPTSHEFFRESWLRRLARDSVSSLSIIDVSGDSMEDTLRSGDQILVDRSVRRIVKDGIYILLFEGQLLVKRCQRDISDGAIIVKSDNPKYDPIRLKKGAALDVIGMVLWVGRSMA